MLAAGWRRWGCGGGEGGEDGVIARGHRVDEHTRCKQFTLSRARWSLRAHAHHQRADGRFCDCGASLRMFLPACSSDSDERRSTTAHLPIPAGSENRGSHTIMSGLGSSVFFSSASWALILLCVTNRICTLKHTSTTTINIFRTPTFYTIFFMDDWSCCCCRRRRSVELIFMIYTLMFFFVVFVRQLICSCTAVGRAL